MKESKIKIYEYRILFDKKEKFKKELEIGSLDLNFRLSFFKKKMSKEYNNILSNQEKNIEKSKDVLREKKENKQIKSLYRKITSITHPDKTSGINSSQIIEKYNDFYRMTVDSYNNNKFSNVIMIANDLLIDIEENLIDEYIDPEIIKIKEEIEKIQKKLGYQWYHIPDDSKNVYFKKILNQYGYLFSDQEVKNAIKKPAPSRKVGTRPKTLREKRRISGKH